MTTVTVDAEAAAFLVAHALNSLHADEQELGCCPKCCGPCGALQQLQSAGQLDDLVRPVADGYEWWRSEQVDRGWLAHAWRMTACHEGLGDD